MVKKGKRRYYIKAADTADEDSVMESRIKIKLLCNERSQAVDGETYSNGVERYNGIFYAADRYWVAVPVLLANWVVGRVPASQCELYEALDIRKVYEETMNTLLHRYSIKSHLAIEKYITEKHSTEIPQIVIGHTCDVGTFGVAYKPLCFRSAMQEKVRSGKEARVTVMVCRRNTITTDKK
uniref:Uncharacterized protein n=1 Tax=viral metagenome TaxID=1070528 RepID=A0A2V0RBU8_9ZZZZ